MKQFIWISSVLVATLIILTSWVTELNYVNLAQPVVAAPASQESLTPEDRKAIEKIGIEFISLNYTYTYEDYVEAGLKVLPLLTKDFKDNYKTELEKSVIAANAVKAKSSVISSQIINVEKYEQNKGAIHLHFKAKVTNNGNESIAKYSTELGLEKVGNEWSISNILSEEPVEFIELKNLL